MKTILSVIGARPQFIKHAPVQLALQKHFRVLTLHTGQHYDENMSQVFFDGLDIPEPDYILDMGGSKPQGEQTGIIMMETERICAVLKPDAIIVYGDTNSTLAGVLVAAKMHIPCIHIEAGLRSFNREMPEEVNRIIADTFSQILFCPTQTSIENLSKEGVHNGKIFCSGDVMCDTLELIRPLIRPIASGKYYFATVHRPSNADDRKRMTRILDALNALHHPVVFPMHPRAVAHLGHWDIDTALYNNIEFITPVSYLESISYQAFSECVITDSGGIQKEAYLLKKKCLTLRSETEWTETLADGWNTLVFEDLENIKNLVLQEPGPYTAGIYGNGKAAIYIADVLNACFNEAIIAANSLIIG